MSSVASISFDSLPKFPQKIGGQENFPNKEGVLTQPVQLINFLSFLIRKTDPFDGSQIDQLINIRFSLSTQAISDPKDLESVCLAAKDKIVALLQGLSPQKFSLLSKGRCPPSARMIFNKIEELQYLKEEGFRFQLHRFVQELLEMKDILNGKQIGQLAMIGHSLSSKVENDEKGARIALLSKGKDICKVLETLGLDNLTRIKDKKERSNFSKQMIEMAIIALLVKSTIFMVEDFQEDFDFLGDLGIRFVQSITQLSIDDFFFLWGHVFNSCQKNFFLDGVCMIHLKSSKFDAIRDTIRMISDEAIQEKWIECVFEQDRQISL